MSNSKQTYAEKTLHKVIFKSTGITAHWQETSIVDGAEVLQDCSRSSTHLPHKKLREIRDRFKPALLKAAGVYSTIEETINRTNLATNPTEKQKEQLEAVKDTMLESTKAMATITGVEWKDGGFIQVNGSVMGDRPVGCSNKVLETDKDILGRNKLSTLWNQLRDEVLAYVLEGKSDQLSLDLKEAPQEKPAGKKSTSKKATKPAAKKPAGKKSTTIKSGTTAKRRGRMTVASKSSQTQAAPN